MPGPGKTVQTTRSQKGLPPPPPQSDSDPEESMLDDKPPVDWLKAFQLLSERLDTLTRTITPLADPTSTVRTPQRRSQMPAPSSSKTRQPEPPPVLGAARRDILPAIEALDLDDEDPADLVSFISSNFATSNYKERDRNELLLLLEVAQQIDRLKPETRKRVVERLRMFAAVASFGWAAAVRADKRRQINVLGLDIQLDIQKGTCLSHLFGASCV